MGYERYPRGTNPQGDYYGRSETQDYGRDYGSGRDQSYSSARDYQSAGTYDRDDDRSSYGQREYGNAGYNRGGGERSQGGDRGYGRDDNRGGYGNRDSYGDNRRDYGAQRYGQSRQGSTGEYHGSYAGDGRRFVDVGSRRDQDDDRRRGGGQDRQSYGRAPQGYDYDDRGFMARAGDEVRSWFGDEDAERRREADNRYDERYYDQQGSQDRDSDYHGWRAGQIAALDRDYGEYRQENRSKFDNEFSSWRTQRQTQRSSLDQVKEHDEVLGSDGSHVGTVDKVRGDRILLTKNDADAGGQHHSIPSRWIQSVEDKKVSLSKTADEAKQHWRTEEKNQAMFGYGDRGNNNDRGNNDRDASGSTSGSGTNLNRSFSGTY